MLHAFAREIACERILFCDGVTTALRPPAGAVFRRAAGSDRAALARAELDEDARWVVTVEGAVAGAGGILLHYNRPYGDIYMAVAAGQRRRGIGAYLVQELKRVCREEGHVPAARCATGNIASRRTLQKAGFVPCGHILVGKVAR
jgi:GNAT superfamily N-acetyltransferase